MEPSSSAGRPEFAREPPQFSRDPPTPRPIRSDRRSNANVRGSKPRSPREIRVSAIRCLHAGHIGRSLIGLPMTPLPNHIRTAPVGGRLARRLKTRFSRDIRPSERPRRGGISCSSAPKARGSASKTLGGLFPEVSKILLQERLSDDRPPSAVDLTPPKSMITCSRHVEVGHQNVDVPFSERRSSASIPLAAVPLRNPVLQHVRGNFQNERIVIDNPVRTTSNSRHSVPVAIQRDLNVIRFDRPPKRNPTRAS